jgi:hypothetical protein
LSLRLLHDLVCSRDRRGLLLVIASRDERRVLSCGDGNGTLVPHAVPPLPAAVTTSVVRDRLSAADEADGSLAAWMAEMSSGNPFYADCLVSHYAETGERFSIPPRLTAIVDQRIQALSPGARDVLETIVALGRNANTRRLAAVLEGDGAILIRHIRELARARLISGESRLEPAHWLIAEAVQRNAHPAALRLLYRRIAIVLENELESTENSGVLWECAQAWLAADDAERAATMLSAYAQHALSIGRSREAADLYFHAASITTDGRAETFAEQSVLAAMAPSDPSAALRAEPLLLRRRSQHMHDDVELALIRARVLSDQNLVGGCIGPLIECVEAVEASTDHR